MEWYEIVIGIVGAVGGVSGCISLYNARPHKEKLEIENYHALLEEEREERELIRKEFKEYKEEVAKYKQFFKEKYDALQVEHNKLEDAINLGYKCPLIEKAEECIIIRRVKCEECGTYKTE